MEFIILSPPLSIRFRLESTEQNRDEYIHNSEIEDPRRKMGSQKITGYYLSKTNHASIGFKLPTHRVRA